MKLLLEKQIQTNLKPAILLDNITTYLIKSRYRITEKTDNVILFVNDFYSPKPASQSDYYTKVDEGKIELIIDNENITINFKGRIPIYRESVFIAIFSCVAITVSYYAILILIVFGINFLIKINYLKRYVLNDAMKINEAI
jgi:hypothetical protein